MSEIEISGVDKVLLLQELWNRQIVASFYNNMFTSWMTPKFDEFEAHKAINGGYIDYFCGRCIKTDLRKNSVSPRLYDRDAGEGAFLRAVQAVRSASPNHPKCESRDAG